MKFEVRAVQLASNKRYFRRPVLRRAGHVWQGKCGPWPTVVGQRRAKGRGGPWQALKRTIDGPVPSVACQQLCCMMIHPCRRKGRCFLQSMIDLGKGLMSTNADPISEKLRIECDNPRRLPPSEGSHFIGQQNLFLWSGVSDESR